MNRSDSAQSQFLCQMRFVDTKYAFVLGKTEEMCKVNVQLNLEKIMCMISLICMHIYSCTGCQPPCYRKKQKLETGSKIFFKSTFNTCIDVDTLMIVHQKVNSGQAQLNRI